MNNSVTDISKKQSISGLVIKNRLKYVPPKVIIVSILTKTLYRRNRLWSWDKNAYGRV